MDKILSKYSFFQLSNLLISLLFSRLFLSLEIRIIRLPWFIIGKKYISFGKNLSIGRRLRIECFSEENKKKLFFGSNVKINDDVHIGCIDKIEIGNNVLIGSKVLIIDHHHGCYSGENQSNPSTTPDSRRLHSSPIKIDDNVWIGEGVSIMPGIKIGRGSIIGANSVVTKNIPINCIAVGNPCKILKTYNKSTHKWEKKND